MTPGERPTSEYGRYKTAKAAAAATRVGEGGGVEEHVRAEARR